MKLSEFIESRMEEILDAWDEFARTLEPAATHMSPRELRDHAHQILRQVITDIEAQRHTVQDDARDPPPEGAAPNTAAAIHGTLRETHGFTMVQLAAEYRALRSTVLRMWLPHVGSFDDSAGQDLLGFNESIDRALLESTCTFSEQAGQTRDTFLAILGHDLRSPLAAVSMTASLLQRATTATVEGNVKSGGRLKRSAVMMTSMVNDLLEYSRTQLGAKMPITRVPVNLKDICEAATHDAGSAYPDCPYELSISGDLEARFDGVRIQQVLTNLLTNAAQYRARDTPVRLTLHGTADDITFQVHNEGLAIPDHALKTIFSPLVQLPVGEQQSGRAATSLGLGLFIARTITLAHGGEISVASDGQGTTFTVVIPKKAVAPA